jgi:predicted NAD/FAD-binding protein
MRKFLIILLGVVSLALLVGVLWSFGRGLSDTDVKRITAIVQAETTESILEIERQRDGTVQVSTGVHRGGFDGGGKLFTLKRTFRGWKIVSRGAWMS